jgi:phosphoglycolate phosphatase
MGIVTSLPGTYVEPMLTALGIADQFAVVIHAGNCLARKPSPTPLLMALARLGNAPSEGVWFVGDMATDGTAARRAGIEFAWASYGYLDDSPDAEAVVLTQFFDVLGL